METESALVMMGEQKTQLQDKIRIVEGPLKMGEKILHDDIWSHVLEKTILLQYDNMQKNGEEKRQLKKDNEELKSENEELKRRIAELESKQKEEDSEEEEDPEERIVYSSSEELSYEEWEAKELKRLKEEERRDPPSPTCLKRLKRG
jgi:predicted glutamine amidotransferase